MIFDIAIVLTWLAAIYRAWVLITQPRTIWRTSFSVSIMIAAVAFTLYRFRMPLDELIGAWNLTGLLVRLLFAVGAAFLLIYLDALRLPTVSPRRVKIYLATAGVAALALTTFWILAPVHDRPLDDLLPLAGHPAVVAYCLTFWGYLLTALLLTAWTCLAQGRTFRRADPARSVSLLLIGLSGVATVPVVVLWTSSILVRHVTGVEATHVNSIADVLLPLPVLLNAIGVLSLLTVPYVSALLVSWWRWRQLKPLWAAMTERYPQVHLDLESAGGPLARIQTRVERAIIEIHDALRLARVDLTAERLTDSPLVALTSALHAGDDGRRFSDVLSRVDSREAEVQQMVGLARAYRDASRQLA